MHNRCYAADGALSNGLCNGTLHLLFRGVGRGEGGGGGGGGLNVGSGAIFQKSRHESAAA